MSDDNAIASPLVAGLTAPRFNSTGLANGTSGKICNADGSRISLLISCRCTLLNGQIVDIRAGSNASAPIIASLTAGCNYIVLDVEKFGVLTHYELWATANGGDNTVAVTEVLRVR